MARPSRSKSLTFPSPHRVGQTRGIEIPVRVEDRGGTITLNLDLGGVVRPRGGSRLDRARGVTVVDTVEVRGRGAGVRMADEAALFVEATEVDMGGTLMARNEDLDTRMDLEAVLVLEGMTTGEEVMAIETDPVRLSTTMTAVDSQGRRLDPPDLADRTTDLDVVVPMYEDPPVVARPADPGLVPDRTRARSRPDREDGEVDPARPPTLVRDRGACPGRGRTPDPSPDPGLLRRGRAERFLAVPVEASAAAEVP